MFPTAGYFRSTNCPFFVHGLCHRPYCHFRHSKPGHKTSKSKISPHKHNTELERHAVNKTNTSSQETSTADSSHTSVKITTPEDKAGNSHSDTARHTAGHSNEDRHSPTTTSIKSILKRTNSVNDQEFNTNSKEARPVDSFDQKESTTSSHLAAEDYVEMPELDDTEQPFASLTEEEKKIIGLTACPPSGNSQNNLSVNKTIDVKSSVSYFSAISSVNSHSSTLKKSSENNTGLKGAISGNHGDINAHDAEIGRSQSERLYESALNDITAKAVDEIDEMQVDSSMADSVSKTSNLTDAINKKSGNDDKRRKRKSSVQLQIVDEDHQQKTAVTDVAAKKRKSQQLPCVASCSDDSHVVKDKETSKDIKRNEETTLQQFLNKSSLKSPKGPEHSRKVMPSDTSPDVKRQKTVPRSPVKLEDKTPVKNVTKESVLSPKKKVPMAETEINFFGPRKKAKKSDKVEKPKTDKEKTSPVKALKSPKVEKRVLEKNKSVQKTKQKTVVPITISSSDDDHDMYSPDNQDSTADEHDSLKKIWDDFQLPQNDYEMEEVVHVQSPVKNQIHESPRKRIPSTSTGTGVEKQPSMVDTLGLNKKKRVAHASGHLPGRLSSNANPVRKYPKTLSAVRNKQETSTESLKSSTEASVSYTPAKQRVAHVMKSKAPAGSLPRPRIPVEYGAKVPQSQRQRYLDRIVDEYLRLCSTQKEAFEKAVEEEKALYERSTRRQVYLNLCVNAIKKLRDLVQLELPPAPTQTTTAVTKTLSSGAVLVSTKSPAKQAKPAVAATNQLTEEVMYDYLSKYLMSEDDLVQNGYPRQCPSAPGKAIFKPRKEQVSKDPLRRVCCRCGKPFRVLEDGNYLTKEECVYHAGKLFRKRGEQITNYSCCQGDPDESDAGGFNFELRAEQNQKSSETFAIKIVHVSDNVYNTDGFLTTIVSPLTDQPKKIFSMDCEMCYTTAGLELTRITVVNWNLEQVYDTFVVPERPIMDYNTRFSGVTEESLRGVTTTIHEVQAVLLSMIHRDTILVGHSLESDLKATKLIHSKVVDTSVVFPHRLGPPYKRALRHLMAEHLKKIIQDSVEGHDSHEDAAACLELMRWKVKEDMRQTARHRSTH